MGPIFPIPQTHTHLQGVLGNTLEPTEARNVFRSYLKTSSPSTVFQNLKTQTYEPKLHFLLVPECFYVNLQSLSRMFGYTGCGDRSGAPDYIELDDVGQVVVATG